VCVFHKKVFRNMNSFLPSAAGGYHHHQHQQQAGNHHLATTSSLVDPKFPPNEEYSQSNYIPSTGADFFSGSSGSHHLSHPQSQLQYGYHQHHHQAASTPYGASSAVQLNGGSDITDLIILTTKCMQFITPVYILIITRWVL